jgi:hypothetical protein
MNRAVFFIDFLLLHYYSHLIYIWLLYYIFSSKIWLSLCPSTFFTYFENQKQKRQKALENREIPVLLFFEKGCCGILWGGKIECGTHLVTHKKAMPNG